jgi:glycosyltransferase involved in cell wall biosynthesis
VKPTIAFVWENFGPMHVDRCEAVRRRGFDVVGIEFANQSNTYEWLPTAENFHKITLFHNLGEEGVGEFRLARALAAACYRSRARHIFFCHYIKPAVAFSAVAMRATGRRVYTMNDSKFDDLRRQFWREMVKKQMLKPYHGCLAAGTRSRDYVRFLGMQPEKIVPGYDTITVRSMQDRPAEEFSRQTPLVDRHFTIVARLVEKKNHRLALKAYRLYVAQNPHPRKLVICGSGPLESELKAYARELSIEQFVTFTGFIHGEDVRRTLESTLALILPSIEEQFGLVVPEAIAMGVPVLVSEACGARDELVRTGVNGFVFEPDNADGLALFMSMLSSDEKLWKQMSDASRRFLPLCDVEAFADGVERLIS